MASEPTDLIRAVDLVHVAGYGHPPNGGPAEKFCKRCQSAWPCEVRRLRDALVAERRQIAAVAGAGAQSEAALAEANATISRVKALADEWMGDGANPRSFLKRIAGMALRRAIEGPAPEVSS